MVGDSRWTNKPPSYITQVNSAFQPSGVGKTLALLIYGGARSPVWWQVTLCNPIWQWHSTALTWVS